MGRSLPLPVTCVSRTAKKPACRSLKIGGGPVPGGAPMARLSRLMGRGRALEVIFSANDVPGDVAERYGYVNRSLPDADLDGSVDALATRIASFDKGQSWIPIALSTSRDCLLLSNSNPGGTCAWL